MSISLLHKLHVLIITKKLLLAGLSFRLRVYYRVDNVFLPVVYALNIERTVYYSALSKNITSQGKWPSLQLRF